MYKRDDGKLAIDIDCFCSGKHCEGNLFIQPDKIDKEFVFMISATDTSGDSEGNLWLSPKQIRQLIKELNILLEENNV